ncbi:MAG: hypothetical protein K0R62_1373 [Nonomuraea muscovyensis]|nr:hypothetical protein [Nonomuraea muscovyensis]
MARDENDRSYEDGQGRSLNPELTGDVLSPRWSTDDTDEQPAIVVSGNETYIMPPGGGPAEPYVPPQDALDTSYPAVDGGDALDTPSSAAGGVDGAALGQAAGYTGAETGPRVEVGGYADADSGAHRVQDGAVPYADSDSGAHYVTGEMGGYADSDSGAHLVQDVGHDDTPEPHDPAYLPLDKGYDGHDDDGSGETRRGFLGSGWTDAGDDREAGDKEVRRRTKVLVAGAVAVVLLGVGAGWMLTGTSSDDPCRGDRCASAGQVSAPAAESPAPQETDEAIDDSADTPTTEPTASQTTAPTPTTVRARVTRTPSPRATRTRETEPTVRPTRRATQEPDVIEDTGTDRRQAATQQPEPRGTGQPQEPTTQPTQPSTQAPAPAPTKSSGGGLFDILFPWA